MNKGKLKDLLRASSDECASTLLEDQALPIVIENVADVFVTEGIAEIIGALFGAVAPRVNGVRLNYKQNRLESYIKIAIEQMVKRIEVLESNYLELTEINKEKFKSTYMEWLLDNLYEEKQDKKVQYNINGYINLMNNEANDNLMLLFFDTINELTELDVDILRLYSRENEENIYTICDRYKILPEQAMIVKKKLVRLGLLKSKNDELRDKNIDAVVEYLEKVEKDKKRKVPAGVKLPNIKNPNRSESFSITRLGINYLEVIAE